MGAEPADLHRYRQLRFQQREVTRAIRAAKAAGCEDVRIEFQPDGTMVVLTGKLAQTAPRKNAFDDVL